MSHERLTHLIQAYQEALLAHPEDPMPYEGILSILRGLDAKTITLGQARRILGYQAIRQDDDPAHQIIYRQAAAVLRQMQREKQ